MNQEDRLGKRKTKRNTRYDSTETESGVRYKNKQKPLMTQSSPVSSDKDHIPNVPKLTSFSDKRKYLSGKVKGKLQESRILLHSEINHIRSPSDELLDRTLTPEPVYTFKEIFESVKRIESK